MTSWKTLTDSKVKNHPLYGIGGWSILFFILLLIRIWGTIAVVGGRSDVALIWYIVDVLLILWNLQVIFLFLNKDQQFVNSYIGLVVAGIVFGVVLYVAEYDQIPDVARSFAQRDFLRTWIIWQSAIGVAVALLINVGLLVYVFRSRRMRVTFFHQVLSADPTLFESDHKKSEVVGQVPLNLPPSKKAEKVPTPSEKPLRDLDDDQLFKIAWRESEGNSRDEDLWAKLFVDNDGDENKTKASYTKLRFGELKEQGKDERAKWEKNQRIKEEARENLYKQLSEEEKTLYRKLRDVTPLAANEKALSKHGLLLFKQAIDRRDHENILRMIRSGADVKLILNDDTDLQVWKALRSDTELKSILTVASRLWDKGVITEDGLVE